MSHYVYTFNVTYVFQIYKVSIGKICFTSIRCSDTLSILHHIRWEDAIMPRGKRREVQLTSENIRNAITETEQKIEALTTQVKELRLQKKELIKDLAAAEKKEEEEKKQAEMEALAELIKEKNLTVDDVRKVLEK